MSDKKLFKMFIYFCLIISSILILIMLMSYVDAADLKILVKLEELDNGNPIDAKAISIEVEGNSEELVRKRTGLYEFKGSLETNGLEVCEFNIKLQEPFFNRLVKVKGDRFKQKVASSFTFSIAKQAQFTYAYLDRGLKYFDLQKFDSALSHFEIAYNKEGRSLEAVRDIDMYAIKLGYNYARSLHNTCIHLKYDTCDLSIGLYDKLLELYDSENYKRIFKDLRIDRDTLMRARKDLEEIGPQSKYRRISNLFSEGRYLEAATLAAEGLNDLEKNPEVFNKIGLTKNRLLNDAGVSYLKAAEEAEKKGYTPDEIQKLLEASREILKEIKSPDNITKSNLNIIEEKLKRLNNP